MRATTYRRLLHTLQQSGAYQRIVDAIPQSRAQWLMRCWGVVHGHHPGTPHADDQPAQASAMAALAHAAVKLFDTRDLTDRLQLSTAHLVSEQRH